MMDPKTSTVKWDIRKSEKVPDKVITESPLELRMIHYDSALNRKVEVIFTTMRTPGNDIDLMKGYLLSSGLIASLSDVSSINQVSDTVTEAIMVASYRLDFSLQQVGIIHSACGICGKKDLLDMESDSSGLPWSSSFQIIYEKLKIVRKEFVSMQSLFSVTGGSHAACFFDEEGKIIDSAEDVGRHTAVDKAIGKMGRDNFSDYGLMVTSRVSYEIMMKAMYIGCPIVIGMGAATSAAIEVAEAHGITLIGFFKNTNYALYTHPSRIL